MDENKKPRVLAYDLEISPTLGWTYGLFQTNVLHVEKEPHIMCFAYQWEGESVKCVSQKDMSQDDDLEVVERLWKLLDEADVVIAHNARRFDNRVAYERFLVHRLGPPSPFQTIDTLAEVRKVFKNGSNSLNNLCNKLCLGRKTEQTHGQLWHRCLGGDKKAQKKMVKYCINDVVLLSRLYQTINPFITKLPNVAMMMGKVENCPRCGADKKHLEYRGYKYTQTAKYHRIRCQKCGGWSQERLMDKDTRQYEVPVYKSI